MGLLDGIIDAVFGSEEQDNGFNQQAWDQYNDELSDALDSGRFGDAERLTKEYYKHYESEKDFYYFWHRTCTFVRWLESDSSLAKEQFLNIQKKAKGAIQQALTMSNDEQYSDVLDMQKRLEEISDYWNGLFANVELWNNMMTSYRAAIDEYDYEGAKSIVQNYYDQTGESLDFIYYDKMLLCNCKMYLSLDLSFEEAESYRRIIEEQLEAARVVATEDDRPSYEFIRSQVHRHLFLRPANICLNEGDVDGAFNLLAKFRREEPECELFYQSYRVTILQDKWSSLPASSLERKQVEAEIEDAYSKWEQSCSDEEDRNRFLEDYNEFMARKAEAENMPSTDPVIVEEELSDAESQYREEVMFILEDGDITDMERKFLERKRQKLGISEERARDIELSCSSPSSSFTEVEKEYISVYNEIVTDGVLPTGRLRKLLDREADSLGLSSERVAEIEKAISKG